MTRTPGHTRQHRRDSRIGFAIFRIGTTAMHGDEQGVGNAFVTIDTGVRLGRRSRDRLVAGAFATPGTLLE